MLVWQRSHARGEDSIITRPLCISLTCTLMHLLVGFVRSLFMVLLSFLPYFGLGQATASAFELFTESATKEIEQHKSMVKVSSKKRRRNHGVCLLKLVKPCPPPHMEMCSHVLSSSSCTELLHDGCFLLGWLTGASPLPMPMPMPMHAWVSLHVPEQKYQILIMSRHD